MKILDKEQQEISKKPDPTNPKDLLKYIWPFTYFLNKKYSFIHGAIKSWILEEKSGY